MMEITQDMLESIILPLISDFHSRTLEEFIMHVFISGTAFGIQQERKNNPTHTGER